MLAFTILLAGLSSLLVGLAPALQTSHADLVPALKEAESLVATGRWRLGARNLLVVAQVAMSIVLLVLAGLFLKSFWRIQAIAPGFDVDAISTARLDLDVLRYTRARSQRFYGDVVEQVEALPAWSRQVQPAMCLLGALGAPLSSSSKEMRSRTATGRETHPTPSACP